MTDQPVDEIDARANAMASLVAALYRAADGSIETYTTTAAALSLEVATFEGHPLHPFGPDEVDWLIYTMARLAHQMHIGGLRGRSETDVVDEWLATMIDPAI